MAIPGPVIPVLLSMLVAGQADATLRKCTVAPSLTTGVLVIDDVPAGSFELANRGGRIGIPGTAGAQIPAEEGQPRVAEPPRGESERTRSMRRS